MSVHHRVGEARLALANLRQQARPGVFLPPIVLLATIFVVGYVFRPARTTALQRADLETFFEAAAAVLGTVLIAIVLQANLFSGPALRRMLIYGLLYIALGEAAALTALLPGGSGDVKGVLFALTVSAGIGALLAVVYIGIRLLEEPAPELEIQADGSAVIDDPAVEGVVAAAGESSRPQSGRAVDREAERIARRQRTGDRTAGRARRGGIVLHPDAVADLRQLGPREADLVLAMTERTLGNDRAAQRRSRKLDQDWSELRAGPLRVVFRPLTAEEAATQGQERGSLVRHIVAEEAARAWLSRVASRRPDRDADRRETSA